MLVQVVLVRVEPVLVPEVGPECLDRPLVLAGVEGALDERSVVWLGG